MKKIFKSLLSGILSAIFLVSSLPIAIAAENYEQYLPTITELYIYNNYEGMFTYTIPLPEERYEDYTLKLYYGIGQDTISNGSSFSYDELNQRYTGHLIPSFPDSIFGETYGQFKQGKFPITLRLYSYDCTELLTEKETGYYVDVKTLPPLNVEDITFTKTINQYTQNYEWKADLGNNYPFGRYFIDISPNISFSTIFSEYDEHFILNRFNNLNLNLNSSTESIDEYTFSKEDILISNNRYTNISADGKTIYLEVTQMQNIDSEQSEKPTPEPEKQPEYIYNETDAGESMTIPTINDVTNENQAVNKVQTAVNQATEEQKQSATGIDKLTLLAEEAAAKANTVKLTDNSVSVTAQNISESTALQSTTNVLTAANVQIQRTARNIVNYDLGDAETVNVKTEDVSNKVDAVRVSTSYASATVNANTASDFTMTNKGEKTIEINFNKDTDTTVTLSFPNMNANDKYYAVVDENGNPVGGKYNPATGTIEAKLSESGIYKVVNNEKDFADIKDKSAEMQEAIKLLASKGIINGTTATTFAPDSTISRAEVTALLMRTISLLDPNANGNFADVSTSNWYCGAAGSAKEHNIINGYEDNTFRGNAIIAKDQIVAVSARTLKQQMNYKTPSDVAGELSVYSDANSIASWAKEDVALATMTNLVLKRTDNTFSGADGMTRGDAAIIMQRLFNKLW